MAHEIRITSGAFTQELVIRFVPVNTLNPPKLEDLLKESQSLAQVLFHYLPSFTFSNMSLKIKDLDKIIEDYEKELANAKDGEEI